jgi:GH18 family chitinase
VYNTVIIFDVVSWDRDGNLAFKFARSGNVEDSEEAFARELNALKEIISMRSDLDHEVNLIITGLADGAWSQYSGDHRSVNLFMDLHRDRVVDQLIDLLKKYQLNGVDIDWEYPQNARDWRNFNDFITKLDNRLIDEIAPMFGGKKILSGALSSWALGMSKEVLQRFDQIQYMAYDGADEDGFQSTQMQSVRGLADFVRSGADPRRINIGIAAYGRPANGAPFWPFWRNVTGCQNMMYWNNRHLVIAEGNTLMEAFFVSPAHAGDKLAYALLAGVGGVMVFRLACDKFPCDPNSVVMGLRNALVRYG